MSAVPEIVPMETPAATASEPSRAGVQVTLTGEADAPPIGKGSAG